MEDEVMDTDDADEKDDIDHIIERLCKITDIDIETFGDDIQDKTGVFPGGGRKWIKGVFQHI